MRAASCISLFPWTLKRRKKMQTREANRCNQLLVHFRLLFAKQSDPGRHTRLLTDDDDHCTDALWPELVSLHSWWLTTQFLSLQRRLSLLVIGKMLIYFPVSHLDVCRFPWFLCLQVGVNGQSGGTVTTRACSIAPAAAMRTKRLRSVSARATSPSLGRASLTRCRVSAWSHM